MKKTAVKKLIALIVCAVTVAAFLTGCTIFEYDEDADMEQAIIDIAPISYTYEVPLREDYTDPYGRTVYELDESGNKTDKPVSSVVRDHDGNPVHVPATNASGEFLYVGYDTKSDENGNEVSERVAGGVTASDPRVYTEADGKNGDNHFIVLTEANGVSVERSYTADEYRFEGLVAATGNAYYALWTKVSDGSPAYGKVKVCAPGESEENGTSYVPADTEALYVVELPEVLYFRTGSAPDPSRDTWSWTEYVHESVTAQGETAGDSVYKQTVIEYFDESGYTYYSENGYTIDEIFDEITEQLYTSSIEISEAEIAIAGGYVDWGVPEINDVNKTIYEGIDAALDELYAEIMGEEHDDGSSVSGDDSTAPSTPEDGMENYTVWHITQEPDRLVGSGATAEVRSGERAAMRRLVDAVEDYVDNERAMSAEDRAKYENEIADMRKRLNTPSDVDELYVGFGNYEVVRYIYGQSREYGLMTEGLREYIAGETITADTAEAKRAFADEVARQKAAYSADINTYYDEATGDTTILYYADEEIFWVKHILIPFSEEQTDALEAYKNKGHSDADVEAFRRKLGMNVVAEKFGEDGEATGETCTIYQAWSDIKAKMSAVAGDPYAAATTFDTLIDTYNTDEGIRDNEMGYAVTATSEKNGGREETYMIEFATESRALYNAYRKGMSLDGFKNSDPDDAYEADPDFTAPANVVNEGSISVPVLTDYGWHIMFLNVVPKVGQSLSFDSYLTPAKITKAGESFVEDVTESQNAFYESWLSSAANRYYKNGEVITVYKNRFERYLDDYDESFSSQQTADEEQAAAEEEANSGSSTGTTTA